MDIYFSDEFNEVSLIFKGFIIGDCSDEGYIKVKYSLGELFINFIELDHDEIINIIEGEFNQIEKDYSTFESNINNLLKKLTNIHPYFFDSYEGFKITLIPYHDEISDYYELKKILQNNESWFGDEKNIQIIEKVLSEHSYSLTKDIKSSHEFKRKLKEIFRRNEDKIKSKTKYFKKELIEFCEEGKKYKEAVEYCLDSENPSEYNDLSTIERCFLFEQTHEKYYLKNFIIPSYKIGTKNNLDKFKEVFSATNSTNHNELKKSLPNEPLIIFEVYQTTIKGICYFEFMKLVSKGVFVQKCRNCNKYFINKNRADTLYCDRKVDETGKTCKDVGAMNTYRENVKSNPIMEIYQKYYKKNYARTKYKSESKKMSKHDFEKWSNDAMIMRDKAKLGQITYDEFKNWLENS